MIVNNHLPIHTKEIISNYLIFTELKTEDIYTLSTNCDSSYNVYSNGIITRDESSLNIECPSNESDDLLVFIYNDTKTVLIYTNQCISYNDENSKYEIYGYFTTNLKNTTVTIQNDGWQTLQLDNCKLFSY